MQRISVELTAAERRQLRRYRSGGLHLAREVNRAHILAALDGGVSDKQIVAVLGVTRAVIWRTRAAYREKGLHYALRDVARPGAPRVYATREESAVAALSRGPAPAGRKRWTVALLTAAARRRHPKLKKVSRETVRRWLSRNDSVGS